MTPIKHLILVLVLFMVALANLSGQANPFFQKNDPPVPAQTAPATEVQAEPEAQAAEGFSLFGLWREWLVGSQRELMKLLESAFQDFTTTGSSSLIWALLGAAFLYGIIHTLLPGHAKSVVASYFLSQDAKIGHGLLAGVIFGILHVTGAIVLVGGAYLLLEQTVGRTAETLRTNMSTVSAIAILVLACFLLVNRIRHLRQHHNHHHHEHDHEHSHGTCSHPSHGSQKPRALIPVVIATGIVPCPGSILIMIAGVSLNAIGLSILALVATSIGIGLTLMAISILTILFKSKALSRLEESKSGHVLHGVVELGGVVLIFASGLILLLGGQGI